MIGISELILLVLIIFIIFVFSILPIIFIVKSKRGSGNSKIPWIILTILFSWLGYLVFLIANPKNNETPN